RDQGGGISDDILPKIFDPYFTTKKEGSGLGLATAHSIIAKHNGQLSVASTSPKGTTFTILLPASTEAAPEISHVDKGDISGNARVLVMDDEPLICDLAKRSLEMYGYHVMTASNGDEAIERFSKALEYGLPFDVVILDLTVRGGKGGSETIQELKKLDPDVKAIVSSGYSNDPVMAHYLDYGFSAVVVKPYSLIDLVQAVHDLTFDDVVEEVNSNKIVEHINA
ncbi:MAG: response regulator, partial [Bdellovibrionales bacterium]|nr:response regulator [Bdellovibrionales bacterium]